jgi:hypothetical protein
MRHNVPSNRRAAKPTQCTMLARASALAGVLAVLFDHFILAPEIGGKQLDALLRNL